MCKVTVIIPNYNHGAFLKQRIDSVLTQTWTDFEVIILDDKSTDNSHEVIEEYRSHPKVSAIVYNTINSGSTFLQWEKGMTLAKGEYIWIAESDDYADNNFLETAMSRMEKDQSELFYCMSVQVDENNVLLNKLEWWLHDMDAYKWSNDYTISATTELKNFLIYKNFIANASSVVFKKNERLTDYLNVVKKFRYCGDWLFWLQYLKDTSHVSYSIKTCNYWRSHQQTTRAAPAYSKNNEMMAIYQWISKYVLLKDDPALLQYYFRQHLIKVSRRNLKRQLELLMQGSRYTKLFPGVFFKYFFIHKI